MARILPLLLAVVLIGLGVSLYRARVVNQLDADASVDAEPEYLLSPDAGYATVSNSQASVTDAAPVSEQQFVAVPQQVDGPTDKSQSGDGHDAAEEGKPTAEELKLLADWKTPRAALLFTGEQHGYIEPCGCALEQYGGMSRRGDLIKKLEERKWPIGAFDLGGLTKRSGKQALKKFETTMNGLDGLKYKAVGLGPEDLRLGADILLSLHNPDGLGFVSANVVMYESPELMALYKVVEIGDAKVAVTAILGNSDAMKVIPKSSPNFAFKQTDPEVALPAVIAEMKKAKPDLLVLMSHASFKETEALLKKFPEFDVVVSAGGGEEGRGESLVVGKTTVLRVGQKGKHTGVLGWYPDAEKPFRFELVKLDRHRFGDDPAMVNLMRLYQMELFDDELANVTSAVPHPSNATFVGAEKCGECHSSAFEIWETSKHAHAFLSLDPKNKTDGYERLKGIDRSFDPECISCHVTGWDPTDYFRYESGFINEKFATTDALKEMSKNLKGSQCESCHGPGSLHVQRIDDEESLAKTDKAPGRESVRVTLKQAEDQVCNKCHDLDNSPKFKFGEYWPQVKHGLD